MRVFGTTPGLAAVAALILLSGAAAQPLAPELKAKIDAKVKELQGWGSDPVIVAAVRQHNAALTADEKAMTTRSGPS